MTWRPHPGPQTDFCSRGEYEVGYGGSAGPGKTDCLIAEATRYIGHKNYRGLILRRNFPQLQEVLDRCWSLYPYLGGIYRATEHRWYFPSGATINLGHMQHENDKYNYQGKEYQGIFYDEVTQFTESQYLYLHSRARSTDPNIPPRIRCATNPGGIGHKWFKKRFLSIGPNKVLIDPVTGLSRVFIQAKIQDNPTLLDNDPAYLERLKNLPEIERRRLLEGDWDSFEGQAFAELTTRDHGYEDVDIPPEWSIFCCLDWGYAKPFSVGWYAVDYDDCIWRFAEWYGCEEGQPDLGIRMPAPEVAEGILQREREMGITPRVRFGDPSIWGKYGSIPSRRRETVGPSVGEDMLRAGVVFLRADNDRIQGKGQCHRRLMLREVVDHKTGAVITAEPMFRCALSCEHWWRTVPSLQMSPLNPEDVDDEAEDHCYDEWRYAMMSRPLRPQKVVAVPQGSIREERARLIRAKDYSRRHGVSLNQAYERMR